jgi:hypothetical protein
MSEHEGWNIYSVGDEDMSFVFYNEQIVMAGKYEMVKKNLTAIKQNAGSSSPAWREMIKSVQYKSGMFCVVETPGLMEEIEDQIDSIGEKTPLKSIRSVQQMSISARFSEKVLVDGSGAFENPEKAELFHDAIKGAIATLKLSISDDRSAVDILNKIKVQQRGQAVKINFEMSIEELETIMNRQNDFLLTHR